MEYKDLSSVCQALREKRKKLNLSLEKVSLNTKLSPAILRRIESEDHLESMNQVYLKGFIKIYASFLQEDDIVKSLDNIFYSSSPSIPEAEKTAPVGRFRSNLKDNLLLLMGILVLAILLFLSSLLIRRFFSYLRHPSNSVVAGSKIEKQKNQQKLKIAAPKQSSFRLILALRTRAEVFIEVKVDGELVFRDTVSRGIKDSWEAKKKIVLFINNPSFLDIEFNGERVPTTRTRPTTYVFTPQGFKISQ